MDFTEIIMLGLVIESLSHGGLASLGPSCMTVEICGSSYDSLTMGEAFRSNGFILRAREKR